MRVFKFLGTCISLFLVVNIFMATSAQSATPIRKAKCYGESDFPHISRHFPGTVNIVARTICPGQEVWVSIILKRRSFLFFSEIKTKDARGFGKIQSNVWMNCKWKPKTNPIQYEVIVTHGNASRQFAPTGGIIKLKC